MKLGIGFRRGDTAESPVHVEGEAGEVGDALDQKLLLVHRSRVRQKFPTPGRLLRCNQSMDRGIDFF